MTNKLVMCDKYCLDLQKEILKPNESENHGRCFELKPRKSLEVPVIVISRGGREQNESLCYFPREDACCTGQDTVPLVSRSASTFHDQLYDSDGGFNLLR